VSVETWALAVIEASPRMARLGEERCQQLGIQKKIVCPSKHLRGKRYLQAYGVEMQVIEAT